MMSLEKFIALYFPFKTRNICTVKTAKWASGIACVVYFVINFFWFFVVKQLKGDGGARNMACVFGDFYVKYYPTYAKIDGVLYFFGPFAIMGLTNIAIIYKFVQAKLASKRGGTESTNQSLSNAAMRETTILITVTTTFIILTGPANITAAITFEADRASPRGVGSSWLVKIIAGQLVSALHVNLRFYLFSVPAIRSCL